MKSKKKYKSKQKIKDLVGGSDWLRLNRVKIGGVYKKYENVVNQPNFNNIGNLDFLITDIRKLIVSSSNAMANKTTNKIVKHLNQFYKNLAEIKMDIKLQATAVGGSWRVQIEQKSAEAAKRRAMFRSRKYSSSGKSAQRRTTAQSPQQKTMAAQWQSFTHTATTGRRMKKRAKVEKARINRGCHPFGAGACRKDNGSPCPKCAKEYAEEKEKRDSLNPAVVAKKRVKAGVERNEKIRLERLQEGKGRSNRRASIADVILWV